MNTARELSFGVIGLGFGANHARVLSELPGVRLVAVCDPDKARLETAARSRETASYADHEEMLCKEKLDAVIVAVPAGLHEKVATAAIAAGCAVLVEKPLAPTLTEGMRLVETAAAAGVALMPGHIERFNPAVQELARRVQAGEIGRVLHLTARRMGAIVVRAQDVNVVHDSALHDIDVMRYVLGAKSSVSSPKAHRPRHGVRGQHYGAAADPAPTLRRMDRRRATATWTLTGWRRALVRDLTCAAARRVRPRLRCPDAGPLPRQVTRSSGSSRLASGTVTTSRQFALPLSPGSRWCRRSAPS
jgi:predicted dehydrogenase